MDALKREILASLDEWEGSDAYAKVEFVHEMIVYLLYRDMPIVEPRLLEMAHRHDCDGQTLLSVLAEVYAETVRQIPVEGRVLAVKTDEERMSSD